MPYTIAGPMRPGSSPYLRLWARPQIRISFFPISGQSSMPASMCNTSAYIKSFRKIPRSVLFIATILAGYAVAQVATGTPPFGSFGGGPFDTVNLGNLNVHFGIPVVNKAGRGMPFSYVLSYDSSVWFPLGVSGNQ